MSYRKKYCKFGINIFNTSSLEILLDKQLKGIVAEQWNLGNADEKRGGFYLFIFIFIHV